MTDEGGVDSSALQRTEPEIAATYARSRIQSGDLVVSIGPSFGKVMQVPDELSGANLTQGTARVAVRQPAQSRFVFWALRSDFCRQQWEAEVGGATFRALNLEPLADTFVPQPDEAMQENVAQYLDRETARIDDLIDKQKRLIDDLLEYRKSLITAAVTGQIDVREAA